MRRFLITIQYVGTHYNGFQLQPVHPLKTVQGQIEAALEKIFLKNVKIFASGRLDAGVSAQGLKAHFDVENDIKINKIITGLNHFLPLDISITNVEEVPSTFHARYNVTQKTYEYKMYVSKNRLALLEDRYTQIYKMPDIELMKKASKYLLGTHDFSAFMNQGSSIKTTVRTIKKINIKEKDNIVTVTITGKSFLYNMVRIIVGTLLEIGYEKKCPEDIVTILESKNRKNAGKMLEAKGLTLLSVEY